MSMRSPSIVVRGALLVALPCLAFTGCEEKNPESAPPATASVAPVTRGDLSSTLTVEGEADSAMAGRIISGLSANRTLLTSA
jgi:hypothetical protein